ncbi:NAD(P)H-binding protein [Streptacidiphilus griseoplanus]|uniref:NAD(P)H-binding protein n=1 Tax=Peterkaempfera griseoplana TaxID=66896 RepID=UPI0006E3E7C9|nr:NAD(P)H-binding protein [Peterkaempfera griseoplana]
MILVTAATAPVGRSIVEQLLSAGHPVRALTRDAERADLPAGAEVVTGDLADPVAMRDALEGVTAVFLLAVVPGFAPAFLSAAREAGVRRIVFQSSGAVDDSAAAQPNEVAAFHADLEQAIRESGIAWTFLRLEMASANALQWALDVPGQLRAGDVVRGPYAAAAGSPVHPADFAAVAVAALTSDAHEGLTLSMTGSESLTHAEQIRLLGTALGRPLRYEEITPEEAGRAMGPYAPAEALLADWAAHVHRPAPISGTLERITGRPARTFAQWAADHAADFAG